jgi:hypothetical protein
MKYKKFITFSPSAVLDKEDAARTSTRATVNVPPTAYA